MTRARLFGIIFANLFAAFGAGGLLITSLGVTSNRLLVGETILSFLLGPLLALALISVSSKWLRTHGVGLFSFAAAAAIAVLAAVLRSANPKLNGPVEWIYFAFLSFRFCFWAVARSLRMNAAAGHQMKLSWAELSYYMGMIIGLIAWSMILGDTTDTNEVARTSTVLFAALVVDAICQVVAGLFDMRWVRSADIQTNAPRLEAPHDAANTQVVDWRRVIGLALAVISVTAATEAVLFMLVQHQKAAGRARVAAALWAASYIGPAIAAIVCGRFKMTLSWSAERRNRAGAARMVAMSRHGNTAIPYFLPTAVVAVTLAAAAPLLTSRSLWAALAVVAASFFAYELVSLTVLDRIGSEAGEKSGITALVVNCMYVAAALVTWVLIHVAVSEVVPLMVISSVALAAAFILVQSGLFIGRNPPDEEPQNPLPNLGPSGLT